MKKAEAEFLIDTTLDQLEKAMQFLQLPSSIHLSKEAQAMVGKMMQIVGERIKNL